MISKCIFNISITDLHYLLYHVLFNVQQEFSIFQEGNRWLTSLPDSYYSETAGFESPSAKFTKFKVYFIQDRLVPLESLWLI